MAKPLLKPIPDHCWKLLIVLIAFAFPIYGNSNSSADVAAPVKKTTTALNSSQILQEFRENVLEFYNRKRKLHRAPPLILDKALGKEALICAQHWTDKANERETWDGRLPKPAQFDDANYCPNVFGDGWVNIWIGYGYRYYRDLPLAQNASLEGWYGQRSSYKFCTPGLQNNAKHFSAMVWYSSNRLGVGLFVTNNSLAIVHLQSPMPNEGGRQIFLDNVAPYCPGGECPAKTESCGKGGPSANYSEWP